MAQHVGTAGFGVAQGDVAHQFHELAETQRIEVLPGKHLGQHTLEQGVLALDGIHRVVDEFTDVGLSGLAQQVRPAGTGGHKEHVFRRVLVFVFRVGTFKRPLAGLELGVDLFERVGDVLQEDEAEHHVLVLGSIDVLAQLVGGLPELLFQRFFFDGFVSLDSGHIGIFLLGCHPAGERRGCIRGSRRSANHRPGATASPPRQLMLKRAPPWFCQVSYPVVFWRSDTVAQMEPGDSYGTGRR